MVTTLFFVIMFAYIYLYRIQYIISADNNSGDTADRYAVASLVIQIIAYLALGCLYIYNSSCRQDKFMSAGYLVLVMSVLLISSAGIDTNDRTYLIELASWANMVAISSYCVWRLSFILPYCRARLNSLVRTILHGAIVTILLVAIIFAYYESM